MRLTTVTMIKFRNTITARSKPDERQYQQWLSFDYDFSGVICYRTLEKEVVFVKLVRGINLGANCDYFYQRSNIEAYYKALYGGGSAADLKKAIADLTATNCGKLRMMHWLDEPTDAEITQFKLDNADLFD